MQKKLFLLDAFALVFRAYYALIRNPRITSKGRNTNAQFGFLNALMDLINNQKPSHIAVCFDTKALTERHTDFADYKANRQETPEDILTSLSDIKKIIEGLIRAHVNVFALAGHRLQYGAGIPNGSPGYGRICTSLVYHPRAITFQ